MDRDLGAFENSDCEYSENDTENLPSPLSLTGGVHCTRGVPDIPFEPVPEGYAKIIASGFDTIEETYDFTFDPAFSDFLDRRKDLAKEQRDKDPVYVRWGSEDFHILGYGMQGGVRFVLRNDDFLIRIRPKMPYPMSVRYFSAGIWEHGIDMLRQRIFDLIDRAIPDRKGGKFDYVDRIKRADFCFDFECQAIKSELSYAIMDAIICPSSSKRSAIGRTRIETITIGSKKSLEVQIYDKGLEITEASGKTWMYALWERNGWSGPDDQGKAKNVWRLELRFGKEFLRDRNIHTLDELRKHLAKLLAEALGSYRLTKPSLTDSNKRRWPLHPLWQLASDRNNCREMLPIGRQITMSRDALSTILVKQSAGVMRAKSVLDRGDFSTKEISELTKEFEDELTRISNDRPPVEAAQERYRFIDEMK